MPIPFNGNPYADYSGWNNQVNPTWSTPCSAPYPGLLTAYPTSQNTLVCYIVHGAEEADRYSVPLNSTIMLMDYNSAMFWIKKCDSVGQVTMTSYTFQELNQNTPSSDMQSILNRLAKLEARFNESDISTKQPIYGTFADTTDGTSI